jgi:hypothetical protein
MIRVAFEPPKCEHQQESHETDHSETVFQHQGRGEKRVEFNAEPADFLPHLYG